MTSRENTLVTFVLILACYLPAVLIPEIGDALTLIGATTNPLVGFIFPIIFYLKLHPELKWWKKVIAYCVILMTIICSIAILALFVSDKIKLIQGKD